MASEYVYTPPAAVFQPAPYLNYSPYLPHSPFFPPASAVPASPLPPASPYLGSFTPPLSPDDHIDWFSPHRIRRPSWHAGIPPSPFLQPPGTPFRQRRRSFCTSYDPWDDRDHHLPWETTHVQLHPFLNGEALYPGFYFDLASAIFSPLLVIGPGQFVPVSQEELLQPATYPPIPRMLITHDDIPQWPIAVELHHQGYGVPPAPISVGDVLFIVHATLRRQISPYDWARLSLSEQTAVARAYTRRYTSAPSTAEVEADQGVRRVDFLGNRHVFRGLIRAYGGDEFMRWRMIT
ncbi:hypothetical protein ID866_6296 [Astraeus odoratus]|nr:hypothetical protein ID866_6296 [Astraeus odoratus]